MNDDEDDEADTGEDDPEYAEDEIEVEVYAEDEIEIEVVQDSVTGRGIAAKRLKRIEKIRRAKINRLCWQDVKAIRTEKMIQMDLPNKRKKAKVRSERKTAALLNDVLAGSTRATTLDYDVDKRIEEEPENGALFEWQNFCIRFFD